MENGTGLLVGKGIRCGISLENQIEIGDNRRACESLCGIKKIKNMEWKIGEKPFEELVER